MPVIKKEKIFINKHDFEKITKCDSKGNFSIALPVFVCEALEIMEGLRFVSGKTKESVNDGFDKIIRDYVDRKTTLKKVIVYNVKCNMSAHLIGENWHNVKNDAFGDDGYLSTRIKATVFIESQTVKPNGEIIFKYESVRDEEGQLPCPIKDFRQPNFSGNDVNFKMDYTEERRDFFVKINNAICDIIMKLNTLRNTDDLIKAIDAKSFKLSSGDL
ncbi:hypothetical protein KAH94_05865 [bacterium]|nr:hypothetical protein [bacterium]